jgi:tetratricopeptide (TPR) repeat protein
MIPRMTSSRVLRRLGAFAAIVMATLALYQCTYVPIHCSREVWRSEQRLSTSVDRSDRFAQASAANETLTRLSACDTRPLDVNVPMLIALSYRLLLRHDFAVRSYERALAIDRRPEIYLGLGMEQLEAGSRQAAVNTLLQACSFDPKLLDAIEDGQARVEVRKRILAAYGESWLTPP